MHNLFISRLVGTVIFLFSLNVNATSMYVIGDSLSDTGNTFYALGGLTNEPPYTDLIPVAPYSSGRLTNGPVWAERLASKLGIDLKASLIDGTGYAYSGARTGDLTGIIASGIPTLIEQANSIVSLPGMLSADDLFVVWGGGNDIFDAATTGNGVQTAAILNDSLVNINSIISRLADEGASRFLVPNLPNLGQSPLVQSAGPFAVSFVSQLTENYNNNLASLVLPDLEQSLGIEIINLDVNSLLDQITADPASFGLSNVTDACIQADGACLNPDEYLFWDDLHPSAAVHKVIGDIAYASLVPIPATLPLFISALSMIGFYSRQKRHL